MLQPNVPPEPGDVHLWTAKSAAPRSGFDALKAVLSSSEMNHANKLRFEKDRFAYIFSQAVLRAVVASYLRTQPQSIKFELNEFGKPSVSDAGSRPHISFNMSHSAELVVIAVTTGVLIGVDTELVRPIADMESIAEHYFTASERSLNKRVSTESSALQFYKTWTRKEAYIKAVGKGLSIPLKSFDTSMPEGVCARELRSTEDSPHIEKWWLTDLVLPSGYVGALVIERMLSKLTYFEWNE